MPQSGLFLPRTDDFGGSAAAGAANPDKFCVMFDVAEAVFGGHRTRPVVEPAVAHALDPAADSARQVVVMALPADQERLFAVVAPERVRRALVGEPLEVAVDGREAYPLELAVQLLGRDRAVTVAEGVEDRLALFGSPAHESKR